MNALEAEVESVLDDAMAIAPFVVSDVPGELSLDRDAARLAGVDEDVIDEVARDFAHAQSLRERAVDDATRDVDPGDDVGVLNACVGPNYWDVTWRLNIHLNSCNASNLQWLLTGGASTTAVVAALQNALPGVGQVASALTSLGAAVLGAGAAWVGYLGRNDCGIRISYAPLWGSQGQSC